MDLPREIAVEAEITDQLNALGQRQERSGRGPTEWLAQLRQGSDPRTSRHNQQSVELGALGVGEGSGQTDEHEPLSTPARLPGQPLDRGQRRRQDLPLTELVEECSHQHRPGIGTERDG